MTQLKEPPSSTTQESADPQLAEDLKESIIRQLS